MSKTSRVGLWLDRLNRHSNSGETVAEFCKREGVSTPSFYQWKGRLSPRIDTPRKILKRKQPSMTDFSELIVEPASTIAQATLPGGVTLSMGNQTDIVALIVDSLVRSCAAVACDEHQLMLIVSGMTRIFVHTGVTDMRKGFQGLSAIVREEFESDPTDGSLFIFINRICFDHIARELSEFPILHSDDEANGT